MFLQELLSPLCMGQRVRECHSGKIAKDLGMRLGNLKER